MRALQPVSEYVPRNMAQSKIRLRSDLPIDEGERIGGAKKAPVRSLPKHLLPKYFVEHVDGGGNMATLKRHVADIFKRQELLNRDNYLKRMQALLDLEELQSEIDIRQFDMKGGLLLLPFACNSFAFWFIVCSFYRLICIVATPSSSASSQTDQRNGPRGRHSISSRRSWPGREPSVGDSR